STTDCARMGASASGRGGVFVRRVRFLALAFATVALAAGCAGAQSSPGQQSTTSGAGQAAAVTGAEQLRFTAKTLEGKDFSGASLAGKAAVLWFWAPWCPNCQREAPGVASAARENAGKVEFVGVAAQDELPAMQGFVSKYHVDSFQHLADLDASIWRRFGVTSQPAYAFISPNGSIEMVKNQ